jgi:hypothetical protein
MSSTAIPRETRKRSQQLEDLRLNRDVEAVVGSSAISRSGSPASAMAISAR